MPMESKVRIKYVKRAGQWCKTTITLDDKGKPKQSQEWFNSKEEAEK